MTARHEKHEIRDGDLALMKRLLSMPQRFPASFRSWVVSYVETNAQVTQGQVIIPPYTAYTPTLPDDVDLGDGEATGHYIQIGSHVHVYGSFAFGPGFDAGSSTYTVGLPVWGPSGFRVAGVWSFSSLDPGPSISYVTGISVVQDKTLIPRFADAGVQKTLTGASPWTVAANDLFEFCATYEASDAVNYPNP